MKTSLGLGSQCLSFRSFYILLTQLFNANIEKLSPIYDNFLWCLSLWSFYILLTISFNFYIEWLSLI